MLNAVGIIYLLKFEDFPKAIEFFQKAVSVGPDFSEAHNNLGIAYERSKNLTKRYCLIKRRCQIFYTEPLNLHTAISEGSTTGLEDMMRQ